MMVVVFHRKSGTAFEPTLGAVTISRTGADRVFFARQNLRCPCRDGRIWVMQQITVGDAATIDLSGDFNIASPNAGWASWVDD